MPPQPWDFKRCLAFYVGVQDPDSVTPACETSSLLPEPFPCAWNKFSCLVRTSRTVTRQAGIRMMRTSKPEVRARHQHHTPFSVLAFLPVTKFNVHKGVCGTGVGPWIKGSRCKGEQRRQNNEFLDRRHRVMRIFGIYIQERKCHAILTNSLTNLLH